MKLASEIDYTKRDRSKTVYHINGTTSELTKKPARNVRNVEKSCLTRIDKMWAQYGHVYIRLSDGTQQVKTVRETAELASDINHDMTKAIQNPSPNFNIKELKKVRDALVSNLIKVMQQAKDQLTNPQNREQELLNCAYKGVNRKGQKITARSSFSDRILEETKKACPHLAEREITPILRDPSLSPQQADSILRTMNLKREMERNGQQI